MLGKGAFPETHPLSLGMLGMHGTAYANMAMTNPDFVLNVGSRFDDRIVGKPDSFCREAFIAHVDIDPREIGKIIEPHEAIAADGRFFLEALLKEMTLNDPNKYSRGSKWLRRLRGMFANDHMHPDREQWVNRLNEYKRDYPLSYETNGGLSAQAVIDAVYRLTNGESIVTADVGQHQMWAAQFYKTKRPNTWLTSGGAGTMGFGFPAAIGAQFAKPHEQVIAFVGDGGFQMTSYELATACNHKLPIKIVILDNQYLGMVRQWQEAFHGDRQSGVDMEGNPDFVALAKSYGAAGVCIDSPEDLETGLKKAFAISDGPVVIHAKVNKADNVYPMIPPGSPYSAQLLGPSSEKLAQPTGST